MSECCSEQNSSRSFPKKHRCPANGQTYDSVGTKTLLHHIKTPWLVDLKQQGYYFCTDPQCRVVYFGQDDSMFQTSDIKNRIGQKEIKQDRPICYCFDVSQLNAEKDASIKSFVINKTKAALCSCETSNPSGKCCLKDFPVPN
jgi:hypothetical protein